MKPRQPPTPLTEASYYILISLVTARHGYAVMQTAKELSQGRVQIGPGTLYGALANLQSAGLIEPAEPDPQDPRRKRYVVTGLGRQVIKAEIERLQEMIEHGKAMLVGGGDDREPQ